MYNAATQKCSTVDDLIPEPVDDKKILYINPPRHSNPNIQSKMMSKVSNVLDNFIT